MVKVVLTARSVVSGFSLDPTSRPCNMISIVSLRSSNAHGVHRGHGPPPHAPAHGYRHKLNHHGGVQISFDSGIGVYVVAGHSDVFFWDDHFYRWHDSGWQTSAGLDRGWIQVATAKLPGHLARKHAGRGHGHARKRHPAKRGH